MNIFYYLVPIILVPIIIALVSILLIIRFKFKKNGIGKTGWLLIKISIVLHAFFFLVYEVFSQSASTFIRASPFILIFFSGGLFAFPFLILGIAFVLLSIFWFERNNFSILKKAVFILLLLIIVFGIDGIFYGSKNSSILSIPLAKIAINIKSGLGCKILPTMDTYLRETCYENVAIAKGDLNLCHKIFWWGYCYMKVAVATKDEAVCKKIMERASKVSGAYEILGGQAEPAATECYMRLAVIKKDPNLCELLEYKNCKSVCLEQVERGEFREGYVCPRPVN